MPRGRLPTGMVAITFRAPTSTPLMSPPLSFVTNRRPSAGAAEVDAGDAAGPGGASAEEHADDKAANINRMAGRMDLTIMRRHSRACTIHEVPRVDRPW